MSPNGSSVREISSKIASGVRPSMDSVHVEHIMPKKWEANWGNILFKDGSVKDITEASDNFNIQALSMTIKKYFLCYPSISG